MTQILSLYIHGQWSSGETHRVERFSMVVRTPTQMQEKNGTYEIVWPCPVNLTLLYKWDFLVWGLGIGPVWRGVQRIEWLVLPHSPSAWEGITCCNPIGRIEMGRRPENVFTRVNYISVPRPSKQREFRCVSFSWAFNLPGRHRH